jgi:hypothetical protein
VPLPAQISYSLTVLITIIIFYICACFGSRVIIDTMKTAILPHISIFRGPTCMTAECDDGRRMNVAAGQIASFGSRSVREIFCREGTVWITQTGGAGDFILRAGDTFIPRVNGKIVAEGVEKSRIEIQPRV